MSNPIHPLAQQLTGKSTLEECSLDEVKRIVQRHPYFAPAQFLLLQKLRHSGSVEEADGQYKKAVLFYPDPLAFELFIASGNFFYKDETPEPSTIYIDDVSRPMETVGDLRATEEENHTQPEPVLDETEENLPLVFSAIGGEDYEADSASKPVVEDHLLHENRIEKTLEERNAVSSTEQTISPSAELEQVLNLQPPKLENREAVTNEPLHFEPYYTVDYFASQGIKILTDDLPRDKLGKQLKSFTEWLKTMKRLPTPQAGDSTERLAEIGVENMASRSVSESEVLTEAMAEVWAKQGATHKALDIYNKLSLHNPSKRDYFAAKIANLKPV